jgi:asparagine synthase (glutamine-hydrolysing)
MCGIAGLIDPKGGTAEALARAARSMADTLRHRGPDDEGVWVEAETGVALAHRRLSIIDLSALGRQPMESANRRFVTVFNGEIYNYAALQMELANMGERFRSHSDTEVLLSAVCRWGVEDALKRANGMFALALYDRENRTLHLARDRMGQKPLYYGWAGNSFAFASELKALRALPQFEAEVDRAALASFLRHGYVPAPKAIYRGVFKLPPGAILTLPLNAVGARDLANPRPYWSLQEVASRGQAQPLTLSAGEAEAELDALLRDAVRYCMVSDVPVGAFLSGGIDSSTVVALMQTQSSAPVRTFTIGFHEAGYDEAAHAAEVARHLGTDHTEIYVDNVKARSVVPELAQMYDEPFADSSQIPTALVSRLARERVTVSLSGDGGDELFGGYNRYVWAQNADRLRAFAPRLLRHLAARAMAAVPVACWDTLFASGLFPKSLRLPQAGDKLHKLAAVLDAPTSAEIYRRLVSLWPHPERVAIDGVETASLLSSPESWPQIGFPGQMMFLDAAGYLPDDILVKLDRASMAASLEARVPLLDHRVVEFAWRLPRHFRLRGGRGKWLLRQVLKRYVPPSLTERPKMGFGVPIDSWLRGPLRDWAESLLDETRLRNEGFFDPAPIRRRLAEHLSGRRNWQHALWCILMFQSWRERWLGR